ncbi:hypothetical protein WICPIJ_007383 [Wickerhamomyces pijperi]|uniref:Transcription initiation factor TFIID subunit 8 n=1 Tax=Wickerhamomyces pijperi TaxID=599730 RepID=A0A9P8Q1Y0_WICPI|nr:hypothetical protein WICPIJ_007383 [Wickerhamomyces pijperi]
MSQSTPDPQAASDSGHGSIDTTPIPASTASANQLSGKDNQQTEHDKAELNDESNESNDNNQHRSTDSMRPPRDAQDLPHLNQTHYTEHLDSFQQIAKRDLALHLKLLGIHVTSESLDDIFQLFEMHINSLMANLQKITNVQRRKKASPRDLALLLRNCQIRTGELEEEFERTQKGLTDDLIRQKTTLEKLSETIQNPHNQAEEEQEIDVNDPSYVFFVQDHEIYNLVPSTYSNKNQKAIPVFLPEFPPDHTYRKSPIYLNQIPDQKTMRAKLVEESRFVGEAIDKLMISNEVELKEQEDFERQKMKEMESHNIQTTKKPAEGLGYDIWNFTDKKLDIVAYSKARLEYLRRKEEKEQTPLPEEQTQYDSLVSNLSPYAEVDKRGRTVGELVDPSSLLCKLHKEALLSVKILKQKKSERELKRIELQNKADLERREKLKEERRIAKEERLKAAAEAAKAAKEAKAAAKLAKLANTSTVANDTEQSSTVVDDFENFGNTDFDNFDSFGDTNNELVFDFGESRDVDMFANENNNNNEGESPKGKQQADKDDNVKSDKILDEDVVMTEVDQSNVIVPNDEPETAAAEKKPEEEEEDEDMAEFEDLI